MEATSYPQTIDQIALLLNRLDNNHMVEIKSDDNTQTLEIREKPTSLWDRFVQFFYKPSSLRINTAAQFALDYLKFHENDDEEKRKSSEIIKKLAPIFSKLKVDVAKKIAFRELAFSYTGEEVYRSWKNKVQGRMWNEELGRRTLEFNRPIIDAFDHLIEGSSKITRVFVTPFRDSGEYRGCSKFFDFDGYYSNFTEDDCKQILSDENTLLIAIGGEYPKFALAMTGVNRNSKCKSYTMSEDEYKALPHKISDELRQLL